MAWPFRTKAFVGRRGHVAATSQRTRARGITIELLESRIALSVANDHHPLFGLSHVTPPPALTFRVQAVVAAPVVSASRASLAQSAERITINGTGFDRQPGRNVVAFDGGVTGKVVSATPTALVVRLTYKPSGRGVLSAAVTTNGRSSGAPVTVANIVTPPRVTIGFPTLSRSATTLTITGSGFDASNRTNRVSLNGGTTGTVTSATRNLLVVTFTTLPKPGKLTATVMVNGGTSWHSAQVAQVATVDSANFSLVADLYLGECVETFQYSSVGITAGDYVVFTVADYGDDEVDEVDGTTCDTSGAVITGVWSTPVDSSDDQSFTITAIQDSYGYYKFSQYEPAGLIREFAVYSSTGTLLASGSATEVTTQFATSVLL